MTRSAWLDSPLNRGADGLIAIAAIVVATPVLAVTAIAVRLTLGSPVLFCQQRAGRAGRPIDVVKFRSMTDARGPDGVLLTDEQRLTPFGSMLRSSSIDELPQLFSVLRGDMSLIGPRPLPLTYVERYDDEQRRRLDARPGITGWAQVNGRNSLDWATKLALDVWYVEHASPAGRCDDHRQDRSSRVLPIRGCCDRSRDHARVPRHRHRNARRHHRRSLTT